MKHYSPSTLARLARLPAALHEESDVVAHIRSLVITEGREAVGRMLGIAPIRLSFLLRGRGRVSDEIAAKLGYRRVVRFERVS